MAKVCIEFIPIPILNPETQPETYTEITESPLKSKIKLKTEKIIDNKAIFSPPCLSTNKPVNGLIITVAIP